MGNNPAAADVSGTITELMDDVWDKTNCVRKRLKVNHDIESLREEALELKRFLDLYEEMDLNDLPQTTIWMGNQIVEAVTEITAGYEKLKGLT